MRCVEQSLQVELNLLSFCSFQKFYTSLPATVSFLQFITYLREIVLASALQNLIQVNQCLYIICTQKSLYFFRVPVKLVTQWPQLSDGSRKVVNLQIFKHYFIVIIRVGVFLIPSIFLSINGNFEYPLYKKQNTELKWQI